MPALPELLTAAIDHYRASRLPEAESTCRQLLSHAPDHPVALHLAGVIARALGKNDIAIDCLERAIGVVATNAEIHNDLGGAFLAARRFGEAVASFQEALALRPDWADAHSNLGATYGALGQSERALASLKRARELDPNNPAVHNNLAILLKDVGRDDESIACCQRAIQIDSTFVQAYNNLANGLYHQRRLEEAAACCRRAITIKEDFPDTHLTLGNVLKDQGNLDEAVACYQRVLELDPHHPSAHNNLGSVFKDQGKLDEALGSFRRAMQLRPEEPSFGSNFIYTLHFHAALNPLEIYREHVEWNRRHAEPLASRSIALHSNDRSPERRLRVGYVSPDFRSHPVGRFLLPLLEVHDRENFEICCYSSVRNADDRTAQCRANADLWREILGISDETAARMIRDDQIDILVDLTMHMADNRLLVFARRPAPVQTTYLAYCGTTGLATIDYRLTDPYLDPADENEAGGGPIYSEESICLPETYWCYRPPAEIELHITPPALDSGNITFGCLNNFCKVTDATLDAWGQLMQRVAGSRLVIHARPGSHRDRVRDVFARANIAPDRLSFADKLPLRDYLQLYNEIDVALDPFPYGGGTTTCDALWMGVPVVSLAGETAVSRGGLSILSNLGLPELVASNVERYIEIASDLAGDLSRLTHLRGTLRDRMLHSPLMDAPRFARNIETAYRQMWRRWCGK